MSLLCVIVSVLAVSITAKLAPAKVVKTGYLEYREFFGSYCCNNDCTDDSFYNNGIYRTTLGQCGPLVQRHNKVTYGYPQIQTFKHSNAMDFEWQSFKDSKCKHKSGKPKNEGRLDDKCNFDPETGLYSKVKYFHHVAPFTAPGLVVYEHGNKNCNPHVPPRNSMFIPNYVCTNNTITNNRFAKSMISYAQYGYLFEYAEPGCMGNSSYIQLPGPDACWNMGPNSESFQVNQVVYPTMSPVEPPVMPPTGETMHLGDGNVTATMERYYSVWAMHGGVFTLTSTFGDADLFVNPSSMGYPSNSNFMWASTSGLSPDVITADYTCDMGNCEFLVTVRGWAQYSEYSLDFAPIGMN